MKLKKWLVAVCAVGMIFALAACGSGEKTSATPEEQLAAEQALADADYEQLAKLMTDTVAHEDMIAQMAVLRDHVVNGEATEAELLDAYKQLSDDSQHLLSSVKDAQWQTEYYNEHVALLTIAVEALAESELAGYEASAENDESKLEGIQELTTTYRESMDALFNLMGIE